LSQIHKNDDGRRSVGSLDNSNSNSNSGVQNESNDNNPGNNNPKSIVECVFKFGGSSLATADRIDHVARLIKDQIELGYRPRAVVCSAMGKTTNNLLSAGEFALGAYRCCCFSVVLYCTVLLKWIKNGVMERRYYDH